MSAGEVDSKSFENTVDARNEVSSKDKDEGEFSVRGQFKKITEKGDGYLKQIDELLKKSIDNAENKADKIRAENSEIKRKKTPDAQEIGLF